ncbi:hypothetical protein CKO_03451 [Citrobacter koseri ATCC BAA-895]|uniref:Uncharacterized protein n=1 Tax=Citrobacter koseri (strain ATCC BAA-895 / CDC 4225-83 / SGSC4696) TaxID=290338 RepID=A8AM19_CITK8|nr:hypothetical protein CKO_03451 [Citrobacter koseri ATCC BAA-895]
MDVVPFFMAIHRVLNNPASPYLVRMPTTFGIMRCCEALSTINSPFCKAYIFSEYATQKCFTVPVLGFLRHGVRFICNGYVNSSPGARQRYFSRWR